MSGWRRLWIVASVLLGIPAYLIAVDSYRLKLYENYASLAEAKRGLDLAMGLAQARCLTPPNSLKAYPSGYGEAHYLSFSCDTFAQYFDAVPWALLPALILAAIGLTIRWIYRGFKAK